jgi:hypothetical protein
MDGSTPKRQELADKLAHAGCTVDRSGTDWHTAGDFAAALRIPAMAVSPILPSPAAHAAPSSISTTVEFADPDLIGASNFTCRVIKRDRGHWRFGWQVTITNRSRANSKYRIELRFIDGHGHTVDTSVDRPGILVRPGESKSFSGQSHVEADVAPAVDRVTALISSTGSA